MSASADWDNEARRFIGVMLADVRQKVLNTVVADGQPASEQRLDAIMERLPAETWHHALRRAVQREFGLDMRQAEQHPAYRRALELMDRAEVSQGGVEPQGAAASALWVPESARTAPTAQTASAPSPPEPPAPQASLPPSEWDDLAGRILAAAPDQLRRIHREAEQDPEIWEGDPPPPATEEELDRMVADANDLLWRNAIERAGAELLGLRLFDAHRHPAVLRALARQGVTTAGQEMLARGAVTPEQAAELDTPHLPEDLGLPVPYVPPPEGPRPDLFGGQPVSVKHLGGHPHIPVGQPCELSANVAGLLLLFEGARRGEIADAEIAWGHIRELRAEGPETAAERVTIPRVALGGIFAWAKKKQAKTAYLVVDSVVGEVIFEVPGVTPWELRGLLAQVNGWLGQGQLAAPPQAPAVNPPTAA